MSSLQDQLMKSGLINKNKAVQIKSEKRKKAKQQPKGHKATDEIKEAVKAEKAEKAQRDRELNEQKQAELKAKEQKAMIKQMLEHHGIEGYKGEIGYNFMHGTVAKELKVNQKTKQSLVQGTLSVCALDNMIKLIPDVIARKLEELDPTVVLLMHDRKADQEIDEDDMYADYQIPDDLVW